MIRFTVLLVFGCCLSLAVAAADPAFVVFYNSGNATKMINGKALALKKGDQLQVNDQVSLPEKTQLVLVCANFSVVQLKTKGNYTVKSLLTKCKAQNTSASSAYFKYVWSQFAHAHQAPAADPRSFMKTYGAASRGKEVKTNLNTDTIYYYQGKLQIAWQPARVLTLQVYATNANEKLILTAKQAKKANIDSIAAVLKQPGTYYWDFAGQESAKFKLLHILTKRQYEQIKNAILANVVTTTPAETAYLTGYMLEENHFLADAFKYYEKAVKLEPQNQNYKNAIARFAH